MGTYEKLAYQVSDGRAEILLDRPDVMNAYDDEMLAELDAALEASLSDSAVRVVVLSGRGRAFCSGVDLDATAEHAETRRRHEDHRARVDGVYRQLHRGPKPTVAAINGPAVGAGLGFALSCDLRVIAEDAFLREGHLDVGLAPSVGAGWLLPRLVGASKAREIVLLSEDVTPEDAEAYGLVVEVVESGEAMAAARELADRLQELSPAAMRGAIELMNTRQSFEEYVRAASEWQWTCKTRPAQGDGDPP